jgi:hypothetical protein
MEMSMAKDQNPTKITRVNWRVPEFCDAFAMGRTKFYALVAAGKISLTKCGRTTLVTDAEARRFQQSIEAGDI